MFKLIEKNEKWLVIKRWEIVNIVWEWTYFLKNMEVYNIYKNSWLFRDQRLELLYKSNKELVEKHFYVFELSDYEIWIISKLWRVVQLLEWGDIYFYFKWKFEIQIEKIEFSSSPIIPNEYTKKFTLLKEIYGKLHYIQENTINNNEKWLLIINWKINWILDPGKYLFINKFDKIEIIFFPTNKNKLEVSGQELLTKDKYNLRVNSSVYFYITDIIKYYENYSQWFDFIYSEAQFALREIIAKYTLDEILEKKELISLELQEYISKKILKECVKIENVWIKDIILPWEMREIMNQVIQAEKTSQVNAIKRRDEVASVRNMLNTAKLYEENPILLRLKEIETLEKVVEKIKNLNVNNGFDGLLDLVKIRK